MVSVQPFVCPICKKENGCMAETNAAACWCMSVNINQQLLQQVPAELKEKQCICLDCIERYARDNKEHSSN